MKYIFLAAGKSIGQLDNSTPVCLSPYNNHKLILDILLENILEVGGKDIYLVGGFGILKILEKYPKLKFFYNEKWESTKSLASFYSSRTVYNEDLMVSYTDVVYKKTILENLSNVKSKLAITIDSKWKNRYEGRGKNFLVEAEKVFQSKSTKKIRVANGDIVGDEIILGESVGVFYFSRFIVKKLDKIIFDNFNVESSSISDLVTFLSDKFSFEIIDVEGNWAEMDSPADLIQFKFGTKADTLFRLQNKLSYSKILPQIKCTVSEVDEDIDSIINNIRSSFSAAELVVRSSALNEDTHTSSLAGNYASILNVDIKSSDAIRKAINEVSDSYLKGNQLQDQDNQILIQPQLKGVKMSGVLFTKDLETSAPYYTVNYDISDKTDTITSGAKTDESKTFIFSKNFVILPEDEDLKKIILAAQEIERITGHDSLDIEFAIADDKVFILQVRPIAAHKNALKVFNTDVKLELDSIKSFIERQQTRTPKLVGKTTVYGVMPDWNPAEIVGINPHPLAFDLYKEIITDKIRPLIRAEMGYRKINHHPGLYSFSGKPYVDVRMSFNTFTPETISEKTANKLLDFYIDKLIKNPHLHDKVEFDVCITSYDFSFDQRMEELVEVGFTKDEIEEIKASFRKLTSDTVNEVYIKIEEEINKTLSLTEKRNEILNSDLPIENKIVKLIEDCKEFGTYSFSIMARFGFFASILLKSLMRIGIISKVEYDSFFKSVNTVAKEFLKDLSDLTHQAIEKETFLEKYGHLRPGTYDVNSRIYSDNFENYLDLSNPIPHHEDDQFEFEQFTLDQIQQQIEKHQLDFDVNTLLDFAKRATEAREKAKFEFSKNLSKALELIVDFGDEYGISREDVAFINYNSIVKAADGSISSKIVNELFNEIEYNKKKHLITSSIKLPMLITKVQDVDFFFQEESEPNFVTQLVLESEIIVLENQKVDLDNKIVLIENADPGFDWIFSHSIKGLITKYGGAASHMAIRCAEFGLPAAIGCGDVIFESLLRANKVRIDCLNKKISVLQ